jgi:hypothetical protein
MPCCSFLHKHFFCEEIRWRHDAIISVAPRSDKSELFPPFLPGEFYTSERLAIPEKTQSLMFLNG